MRSEDSPWKKAREFEIFAKNVLSSFFNVQLNPMQVFGVPKIFDLVSEDTQIAGDAKYFTLVKGKSIPPAKFSIIAEHVWLLEKTNAKRKFLVFGNDKRVPQKWLEKYGPLVDSVEFYFLDESGKLELLQELDEFVRDAVD